MELRWAQFWHGCLERVRRGHCHLRSARAQARPGNVVHESRAAAHARRVVSRSAGPDRTIESIARQGSGAPNDWVNQSNASFVHVHLGEPAEAKALASSALQIAREIAYPVFEAAALSNLGNAERALGEPGDAIAHMEAGLAIRRSIQYPRDFADDHRSDVRISRRRYSMAEGVGRNALGSVRRFSVRIERKRAVALDGKSWGGHEAKRQGRNGGNCGMFLHTRIVTRGRARSVRA